MNYLKILRLRSKLFYLFLVILGLVSSAVSIGILMMINLTLTGQPVPWVDAYKPLVFVLMLVVSYTTTRVFQNYVISMTRDILFEIELSIVQKVRNSSFESFEKLGVDKIYSAISDARVLSRMPEIFVSLVNAFVTVICALGYLYWTSPGGATIILVGMLNLFFFYVAKNERLEKDLNKVRDLQNTYYRFLQELLLGFKQIRISSLRSANLYERYIFPNRKLSKDLGIRTSKQYLINQLIGSYSWYLLFGVVLFLLPVVVHLKIPDVAVFITSVMFMMGPISQLISFFPFNTQCKIALQRIDQIYKALEVNAVEVGDAPSMHTEFESIRFENVSYRYSSEDSEATFGLDAVNIEILKGEVVFIIGGNGSGKTTFINILTGLCTPSGGKVYIDGREVTWEEYCLFGNNMAVIYSNHHLFKENYDDHDLGKENDLYWDHREKYNLSSVLRTNQKNKYLDTNLSKGEQKRLALLLGLLERKPLIVLDEWAAEQDPANRRSFYMQWLGQMVGMGKTVVAVTHDDDFWHVADKVIKFNAGRAVSEMAIISATN